jgi:hypothetical protein
VGRETVSNIDLINEYEAQSEIIPFVGIVGKEYELRQQCHFIFIHWRVASLKEI